MIDRVVAINSVQESSKSELSLRGKHLFKVWELRCKTFGGGLVHPAIGGGAGGGVIISTSGLTLTNESSKKQQTEMFFVINNRFFL